MFCKNCGAKVEDGALFCDQCGTAIKRDISPDEIFANQIADFNETIEGGIAADKPASNNLRKKSLNTLFAFAALAIAVIVIIIALKFGSFKPDFAGRGITYSYPESNFKNGAVFAYDDDTLYFVGHYDDDKSTCVYSTSYTGANKTLISEDSNIRKIRIANGKILYDTYSENTFSIGIMEKDGSNNAVIIELDKGSDGSLDGFDMASSALYYLYNNELRTCSMDGSGDTLLFSGVEDFLIAGNTIYYSTEKSIFSYGINTAQSTEICSYKADNLVLDEKKIYFMNGDGIYCVPLNGDEGVQRIVKDDCVGNFVIDRDNIYYIRLLNADDKLAMARIMAGRESESVYDTYVSKMNYVLAMNGMGQIERVPKQGGNPEALNSDQSISVALFVYPGGMYSRESYIDNSLYKVLLE